MMKTRDMGAEKGMPDKAVKRESKRIFAGIRYAVSKAWNPTPEQRELAAKCLTEEPNQLIQYYTDRQHYIDRMIVAGAMTQKIVEKSQKKEAILMIAGESKAKAFRKALEFSYVSHNSRFMPNGIRKAADMFLGNLDGALVGKLASKSKTTTNGKHDGREKRSDFDGGPADLREHILRKQFWVYGDRGEGHPRAPSPLQILERAEKQKKIEKQLLELLGTKDAINRRLIELMKAEAEGNTAAIKSLGQRIRELNEEAVKRLKALEKAG